MTSPVKTLAKRLLSDVALMAAPASQHRLLLYHRVEARPRPSDPWSISKSDFDAQLDEIARLGYEIVDLMRLADESPKSQRKRVAIAFDDGYASAIEYAGPGLHEAGYEATFFLVPGAMGAKSTWEEPLGLAPSQVMSWSDAEQLVVAGVGVGPRP